MRYYCFILSIAIIAGLVAKEIIAQQKAKDYYTYCQNSVSNKQHDGHADGNPEQDETNHSLHICHFRYNIGVIYIMQMRQGISHFMNIIL